MDRADPPECNANIAAERRSAGQRKNRFEKHVSPGRCGNHNKSRRRHSHFAEAMILRVNRDDEA
jgi:hypothetical protein